MSLESLVKEYLANGGEIKELPPSQTEEIKLKSNWFTAGKGKSARSMANRHPLQVSPLVEKIFKESK